MKKIIIALDGEHFPKGAFEFAKYLNTENEILLAGIFLSPIDYSRVMAYSNTGEGMAMVPELLMKGDDEVVINKNIDAFEEACNADGLHYRVHKDNDFMALSTLVDETRYADVLLVSTDLFYKNIEPGQPNFYLEEVLKRAECAVMLIPENFIVPKQVILSYNGGASSTFAIKEFSYLFPDLAKKETKLLYVSEDTGEELPGYNMLIELLSSHYPNLQIQNLKMAGKKYFVDWLSEQPSSYIILGSFSRSAFSTLFRKSFAREIIQKIKMPIFISHK
jgi:hypothetical protein